MDQSGKIRFSEPFCLNPFRLCLTSFAAIARLTSAIMSDASNFRTKRADTKVASIEATYGINLNARDDLLLGNLLNERGFDSLSQLLEAYSGQLIYHPRKRRLFLSFHGEDKPQVQGFRLMAMNPNVDLDFFDRSLSVAIDSENSSYIKQVLREKIRRASILVCLIGNGTA